ncbi:uncharacterized protein SCODWIG_03073 [Saccharomycodes ludwigii]|uniref:Glycoside hydrolase family 3 N-terminal domain-containing protein n=1 Tax=Saccharomycodes ludwigii TaxID=36035 RepID=A0A376B9I6_9ASCO|nr:conserved putative glycoside hydrolase [Saccharomycodes ludwigii]KAH3898652.1 conserved putative glycoside hydrolase [Saccharomycodes ludwigii]SSD61312.1 uncharacterized protein SCODWIG_03073 [Saccharomycodes ludwigii]
MSKIYPNIIHSIDTLSSSENNGHTNRMYKNEQEIIDTVGKLFLTGFDGTEVTNEAKLLITKYRVSSMILSGKNFINASQTKKLLKDLQTLAFNSGYKYPLIFCIDEEGGMLNSLFDKKYLTQFPGAMALASTGSEEVVYQVYKKLAIELKSIGFSMYLGPVLDVLKNINPLQQQMIGVRSFGYDPAVVTKFGKAAAKAFKDTGMFNCGKHFPGYGSATVNSNVELPMVLENTEQLLNFNLVPYKNLIDEDLLDSVLVGGCAVPRINGNAIHACLSPTIVNNLVRETLNFEGVIVSECLLMEALDRTFGVVQGCISAFSVGCNLVMLCSNFKIQEEAMNALKSVIADNILEKKVVEDSVAKIENLQKKLPSWSEVLNLKDLSSKTLKEDRLLSKLAYEKSIAIVRDNGIPITNFLKPGLETENTILLLTPLITPLYETIDENGNRSHINSNGMHKDLRYGEDVFVELGRQLAAYKEGYKVLHQSYNSNGLTTFHEELILKSKVVLFVSAETTRNLYQVGVAKHVFILCNQTRARNKAAQMIIISVSSPLDFLYDINFGTTPTGYICLYDYTKNALSNLPHVLFGDLKPTGKIPGISMSNGKLGTLDMQRNKDTDKKGKNSWLVETFNFSRDWDKLITLLKNNNIVDYSASDISLKNWENFFKTENQALTCFVIRNTSSNSILGISVTWISTDFEDIKSCIGNILLLLVDKNKRGISIGSHLYTRTMKYFFDECSCFKVYLCGEFPKLYIKNDLLLEATEENRSSLNFFGSFSWDFDLFKKRGNENNSVIRRDIYRDMRYLLKLDDVSSWKVSENLVRQLQVVGIMFDICKNPEEIIRCYKNKHVLKSAPVAENYELYLEIYQSLLSDDNEYLADGNLNIIVALEPNKRSVVGSLIVFNNNSKFAKFYPFLDSGDADVGYSCIAGHFIDPLYYTLSEVFKLGLICTALMYIKSRTQGTEYPCYIVDIEGKQLNSLHDNGFQTLSKYHNFYSEVKNT